MQSHFRLRNLAAGVAAAVILLTVTLLLAMGWQHTSLLVLPQPTGRFAVGRTQRAWTQGQEAVLAWIWYPSDAFPGAGAAPYLPPKWSTALQTHQGTFMSRFFKHDPATVKTHSLVDAPLATNQPQYSVILLRAGGSALTTDFTSLAEDLASHGFVVVGWDAPGRTFVTVSPDDRVNLRLASNNVEAANGDLDDPVIARLLAAWVGDAKFVVDRLSALFPGRLNLRRLGMVGHSFGGATAFEFCHEDARCQAAADLDGIPFGSVVTEGLAKPGMFLMSDHSREMADPATRLIQARIAALYAQLPPQARFGADIVGANHFSFSDEILTNSPLVIWGLQRVGLFGRLGARRGVAITRAYVRAFFEVHLNGAPSTALRALSLKYPEVRCYGIHDAHFTPPLGACAVPGGPTEATAPPG